MNFTVYNILERPRISLRYWYTLIDVLVGFYSLNENLYIKYISFYLCLPHNPFKGFGMR